MYVHTCNLRLRQRSQARLAMGLPFLELSPEDMMMCEEYLPTRSAGNFLTRLSGRDCR